MTVLRSPSDGSPISTDLRQLAQRMVDTGGQSVGIRFGVTTVNTTASATGSTTVPHGLGRSPLVAFATAVGTAGVVNTEIQSFDGTNVVVRVGYTDAVARTQGNTAYWLAIG